MKAATGFGLSWVFFLLLFSTPAVANSHAVAAPAPVPQSVAANPGHQDDPRAGPSTHPPPMAQPAQASYDEQIGMTFTQSFTSMAYNVTAVEQSDPTSGSGPAYLLNGVSDAGYWYQVGLAWNWSPGSSPGTGFDMIYEVFDSNGNSVYPTSGGGGLVSFSGSVNQGDNVLLNLYFSSTYGVVMFSEDYNTGAQAFETYGAQGASKFVGESSATADANGFFTGLMTEWYHSSAFYGNVSPVTYSNPNFALNSAWMWIDEFSCPDTTCPSTTVLFSDATPGPVSYSNPSQLQEFSSNGATEYSSAYRLITGPAYQALTVSYAVSGGGSGYLPPSFNYFYGGVSQSVPLTQAPVTYMVDAGSGWSVTGTLSGSSQSERWALTGSQAAGVANSSQTMSFLYQNEYLLTVTGGSGGSDGGGWYGSGASATASSSGTFGRSGGTGQRLVSYSIDGTTTSVSPTAGVFMVSVLMDAAHQVAFNSVQQFQLSILGTCNNQSLTSPTLPGDTGWFDAGTKASLSCGTTWDVVPQQTRMVATSYRLNGGAPTLLQGASGGSFTVALTMDAAQTVNVESVPQYFIMFNLTDASGARAIQPSVFQVSIAGQAQRVNGTGIWLDSGDNFTVSRLIYEGVDVKPTVQTLYHVTQPATVTLMGLVFDASVKVTDLFGLPVSGAQVSLTLANGTTVAGATNGGGTFSVADIPLGNFTGRVSGFGSSAVLAGDASKQSLVHASLLLSETSLALVIVLVAVLAAVVGLVARRAAGNRKSPSP